MSEIADILDRAADLIEPEGAWTTGAYARSAGGSVRVNNPDATCFCAVGAIAKALGVEAAEAERWIDNNKVKKLVGARLTLVEWNDRRRQPDVVAGLREAAAKARTPPQYALKNGRV